MSYAALATLESALRARKLDHTLTTSRLPGKGDGRVAPTLTDLDRCLHGGLPRGQLSEITGARSSGRTTLLLQTLAAATRRGEIVTLVDTFDGLDVTSAASAGMVLERLLWVRGHAVSQRTRLGPSAPASRGPTALADRMIERALNAFHLVLQAGGFDLVVLDLADAPVAALTRLPFTTWLRVQRAMEGSDTAGVVIGPCPIARSAGGVTVSLDGRTQWAGEADRSRRLAGLDVTARVISSRRQMVGEAAMAARVAWGA